nr:hypothetical protein [Tanacetum cinerariifolium]
MKICMKYEPQHSEDYQNTAREDSYVEVTASSPILAQPKPSRICQKWTTQNEEAPWCIAWTNDEEIALGKVWVYVSENSIVVNVRRDNGFGMRAHMSGAGDEDYFVKALLDYEAEYRVSFILHHCWEDKAKGLKKKGAGASRLSASTNDEALARLMVSELAMYNERSMAMKK